MWSSPMIAFSSPNRLGGADRPRPTFPPRAKVNAFPADTAVTKVAGNGLAVDSALVLCAAFDHLERHGEF